MKSTQTRFGVLALLLTLAVSAPSRAASLYLQPFDGTGNLYASQNDPGGFGAFATMYDNFTLGSTATIDEVLWYGGYFGGSPSLITGWTLSFYGDSSGTPGTLLYQVPVSGSGGETSVGTFGGFPVFSYDLTGLSFLATGGTQYWLSVVPDLVFPPQWGWASGTGGDGGSYQLFFGSGSPQDADMAFELRGGETAAPEPVTLALLGVGLGATGVRRWRQRRA